MDKTMIKRMEYARNSYVDNWFNMNHYCNDWDKLILNISYKDTLIVRI